MVMRKKLYDGMMMAMHIIYCRDINKTDIYFKIKEQFQDKLKQEKNREKRKGVLPFVVLLSVFRHSEYHLS
jgi:hypothetical protein